MATEWYSDELEKRHALSLLWYVKNYPGMTKTDIVRVEKGGEKTKYSVLTRLMELGLVASEKDPEGRWNSEHLILTEYGSKITEYIESINDVMAQVYSADAGNGKKPKKE